MNPFIGALDRKKGQQNISIKIVLDIKRIIQGDCNNKLKFTRQIKNNKIEICKKINDIRIECCYSS